MLWEFRFGGHVYNGTQYAMTTAGINTLQRIVILLDRRSRKMVKIQICTVYKEYDGLFSNQTKLIYNGKKKQ